MTSPTMAPFGQYPLQDMLTTLRNTMAYGVPGGLSDEALQSYLQAEIQRNIAALNASSQLAQADQTNRLRMMELFGVDASGNPTDAASRWRSELQAQQSVQNERLRQELIQALGYDPTNPSVTTSAERQADEQAAQRWAELSGAVWTPSGQYLGPTLDSQRLAQEAQQAQLERDLRLALQRGELGQQEAEFARTYLLQQDENRRQNVGQAAELSGYQANGQLTEAARAARAGETAQRAATAAQLLGTPRDIFRAGAYFQNLGGGSMTPTGVGLEGNTGIAGFTGFGSRLALPQTLSMADLDQMLGVPQGGYTGTATAPTTTTAPSAPSVPTAPTAPVAPPPTSTAMPSPREALERQAAGPAGPMGVGGFGGPSALPQTANMAAIDRVLGAPQGAVASAPVAPTMPTMPTLPAAAATTAQAAMGQGLAAMPALPLTASPTAQAARGQGFMPTLPPTASPRAQAAMGQGRSSAWALPTTASPRAQERAGRRRRSAMGGPAGPMGMGAGGAFAGREAPNPVAGARAIPFVDPSVLEDPRVKQWLTDMKAMARQDREIKKNTGKGRVQHRTTPASEPGYSKEGMLERERRALRGASRLQQRGLLTGPSGGQGVAGPGGGPGGPVGAPLWPETTTPFPTLQTGGAIGQMTVSPQATSAAPPPVSTSLPAQTDQRLAAVAELLVNRGPGGLAPQTLERMSSTQREVTEGALDALGLNWDDFEDAYAQTRFANVGSALSA